MDWTTANNPSYSKDVDVETEVCEFDGQEYAWFDVVSARYDEALDRSIRVSKTNLKEYNEVLNSIAI